MLPEQTVTPRTAITAESLVGTVGPALSERATAIPTDYPASHGYILDLRGKVGAWVLFINPPPHPSPALVVVRTTQGDEMICIVRATVYMPQE